MERNQKTEAFLRSAAIYAGLNMVLFCLKSLIDGVLIDDEDCKNTLRKAHDLVLCVRGAPDKKIEAHLDNQSAELEFEMAIRDMEKRG